MIKRKVASELVDADVQFISLVPKGANRIPFRLFKSEEGKSVFDLQALFAKNEAKPVITSILVSKDADLALETTRIQEAGFTTADAETVDGGTVFHQVRQSEDTGQLVMKVDDSVAISMTVRKGFNPCDLKTTSFADLFAKEGVIPNIFGATDALIDVIFNILMGETSTPDDAAGLTKKAIAEFSKVITGLIANIPADAFMAPAEMGIMAGGAVMCSKADTKSSTVTEKDTQMTIKKKVEKTEKTADELAAEKAVADQAAADAAAETVQKDATHQQMAATAAQHAVDMATQAAGAAKTEFTDAKDAEDAKDNGADEASENADGSKKKPVKKDEGADAVSLETVMKAITALTTQISDVQASTQANTESLKKFAVLEEKLEAVTVIAKSADKALSGMTNVDAPDDKAIHRTKKSDEPAALRDTGWARPQ